MANIEAELQKILEAVYGEEVRGSIHDGLVKMNRESEYAVDQAVTAKDSAKNSAKAAATSATQSANSAAQSANSATASANSATASANSAANSATSATQSANSAKASKTSADNSAASATQSANSATSSANSATTASTKASEAANSALIASTKASEAATSATNSANSASTAAGHASTASTKATQAANSATAASTSAENAASSASQASQKATQAANSATAAANAASTAAQEALEQVGLLTEGAFTLRSLAIEANTDFNTITTSGYYSVPGGRTYPNFPYNEGGTLLVFYNMAHSSASNNWNPYQMVIGNRTNNIYVRTKSHNSWTNWSVMTKDDRSFSYRKYVAANTDLNTIVNPPGIYFVNTSVKNGPNGDGTYTGELLVFSNTDQGITTCVQTFISLHTNNTFIRNNNCNKWTSWNQVILLDSQVLVGRGDPGNGTDLNTVIKSGFYIIGGGSSYPHSPIDKIAGILVVFAASKRYIQCLIRRENEGEVYLRFSNDDNAANWSNWLKLDSADPTTFLYQGILGFHSDLNNVTKCGYITVAGNSDADYKNQPAKGGGMLFNYYVSSDNSYTPYQLYFNSATEDLYFRNKRNNVWNKWRRCITDADYLMSWRGNLPNNTDINEVRNYGIYGITASNTYTNAPTGWDKSNNLYLFIISTSTSYPTDQIAFDPVTGEYWLRHLLNATLTDPDGLPKLTWGEWKKIEVMDGTAYRVKDKMNSGTTDLDTLLQSGYYVFSNYETISNAPPGITKRFCTLLVMGSSDPNYQKAQLLISDSGVYTRYRGNSSWGNWRTVYNLGQERFIGSILTTNNEYMNSTTLIINSSYTYGNKNYGIRKIVVNSLDDFSLWYEVTPKSTSISEVEGIDPTTNTLFYLCPNKTDCLENNKVFRLLRMTFKYLHLVLNDLTSDIADFAFDHCIFVNCTIRIPLRGNNRVTFDGCVFINCTLMHGASQSRALPMTFIDCEFIHCDYFTNGYNTSGETLSNYFLSCKGNLTIGGDNQFNHSDLAFSGCNMTLTIITTGINPYLGISKPENISPLTPNLLTIIYRSSTTTLTINNYVVSSKYIPLSTGRIIISGNQHTTL